MQYTTKQSTAQENHNHSFTISSQTPHSRSPVPRFANPSNTCGEPAPNLPQGNIYPPFLPPFSNIFSSPGARGDKPAKSSVSAPKRGGCRSTPKIALNHPGAFFCSPVDSAPGCREKETRPWALYVRASSCACITFMAFDWPYFSAWPRKPAADFAFTSSHWTPSGVGEARWPEEETKIMRVLDLGREGSEAVLRQRGVRWCWKRNGPSALMPS